MLWDSWAESLAALVFTIPRLNVRVPRSVIDGAEGGHYWLVVQAGRHVATFRCGWVGYVASEASSYCVLASTCTPCAGYPCIRA